MAAKQQKNARNFLEEYIAIAKERCNKARAKYFARFMVEYFENMAVVTVIVQERYQVAVFVEEADGTYWPTFTYWLDKEQREPIVARMYKAGISGTKIATFLRRSPATIYQDLKAIREHRPFKIEGRQSLRRSDMRQSKLFNDGDFKVAALNFQAQVLDMQSAFLEAQGATIQ